MPRAAVIRRTWWMADVNRWGTPIVRKSRHLLSDVCVILSHGLCQLMCALRGMCFACRVLSIICCFIFLKLLGFSDTDEVKYTNAHLSHYILYSYSYIQPSEVPSHPHMYKHEAAMKASVHTTWTCPWGSWQRQIRVLESQHQWWPLVEDICGRNSCQGLKHTWFSKKKSHKLHQGSQREDLQHICTPNPWICCICMGLLLIRVNSNLLKFEVEREHRNKQ